MENYLEKIKIKGFKKFNNLEIRFNKGWNFIIGNNSCGKTTILRAITVSLKYYGTDYRCKNNFSIESYFRIDGNIKKIGIKHDEQQPIVDNYGEQPSISSISIPEEDGVLTLNYQYLYAEVPPLVIGAYRNLAYKRINGMQREDVMSKNRQHYTSNAAMGLEHSNVHDIKQWMINRYYQIDKEWAKLEKINWDYLVQKIEDISPQGIKLKFERIEKELEPIFSLNGVECYLEELSSGFKSILVILLEIFEWIEKTNEGDRRIVKNAVGTVLIDEIDAHLHPEWQLIIGDALKNIFPKLQFIVTTHSPHVIASAKSGELIILDETKEILEPTSKSYSGWSTDDILEDLMGVKNLAHKDYNKLVNQALDCIEEKNLQGLNNCISKLEEISHSNNTIVQSLKIKLQTLKLEAI